MTDRKIQQIWQNSYETFLSSGYFLSDAQKKASYAILNCKTGSLGMNISLCPDCGHMEFHNNSCRNRNCPNCQAINKELWVDRRRAEVIDSPYFHVVFTLPHELNSLIYCNQKLLYGFFHRCCAETLLELFLQEAEHLVNHTGRSLWITRNSSAVIWCMYCLPVFKKYAIMAFWITDIRPET